MARNVDFVCCCSSALVVCVVVLAFLLPATESFRNPDLLVEYSAAGIHHDFHTSIHSLEGARLRRVKRQQASGSTSPSTSGNSSSAQMTSASSSNSSAQQSVTTSRPPSTTTAATTLRPTTTTTTTTPQPTTTKTSATPTPQPQPQPQSSQQSPPQSPPLPAADKKPPSRKTTPTPDFVKDNHYYYTSMILPGRAGDYFVELDSPSSQGTLNSGHRLAVTISLPFKFRFYGHNITNVTVATGGFIYMSPFLHQWLTATQYIAPLMANFDTSADDDSNIFYKQVGEEFVIEWHNVKLKDQDGYGPFIFQAKLKSDGTITFIYKLLPLPVQNISSTNHPVKIGLSDAFYNDTFLPQYGIKRRTIIEYHRVAFLKEQIEEGTVIVLSPLPTCNTISDCGTCTEHIGVKFQCKWCDMVSRCSDGLDWYRQDWEKQGCKSKAIEGSQQCSPATASVSSSLSTSAIPFNSSVVPAPIPSIQPVTSKAQNPTMEPQGVRPDTAITPKLQTSSKGYTAPSPYTTKTTAPSKATFIKSALPDITTDTMAEQTSVGTHSKQEDCGSSSDGSCTSKNKGEVAAVVAVVLVAVILLGSVAVWLFYAYTHPTSASGIWLMEHRPSQMKVKLANIKFWKKNTPGGTKYAVESEA